MGIADEASMEIDIVGLDEDDEEYEGDDTYEDDGDDSEYLDKGPSRNTQSNPSQTFDHRQGINHASHVPSDIISSLIQPPNVLSTKSTKSSISKKRKLERDGIIAHCNNPISAYTSSFSLKTSNSHPLSPKIVCNNKNLDTLRPNIIQTYPSYQPHSALSSFNMDYDQEEGEIEGEICDLGGTQIQSPQTSHYTFSSQNQDNTHSHIKSSELASDFKSATGRYFTCPYQGCGKIFAHRSNLCKHTKSRHSDAPKPSFPCEKDPGKCQRVFTTKVGRDYHHRTAHHDLLPEDERHHGFTCLVCGFVLTTRQSLEYHMRRTHPDVEDESFVLKFKCQVDGCGRGFSRAQSVVRHHRLFHGIIED